MTSKCVCGVLYSRKQSAVCPLCFERAWDIEYQNRQVFNKKFRMAWEDDIEGTVENIKIAMKQIEERGGTVKIFEENRAKYRKMTQVCN